jgi:enoyl-CoA hydratase
VNSTAIEDQRHREMPVCTELRGKVLWVRLARPGVLNAIDDQMLAALDEALDRAAAPDVRVVVVRGTGRAFSVGADLKQVGGEHLDMSMLTDTVRQIARVVERLAALPKPTLAGLNGLTAAGGLEITLACDLVVAARSARIADAHSNFGLLPGAGGASRLTRLAGPRVAKRLLYTGDFVPAEELVACGLVTEVVDDDHLDDRLHELAGSLAARSPRVLSAMKRLVDEVPDQTVAESLSAEFTALVSHTRTPDLTEGVCAFRERRAPAFADLAAARVTERA